MKTGTKQQQGAVQESPEGGRKLSWIRGDGIELKVRPAPVQREWMDATIDRLAYVCPPLGIANSHCWEILNPEPFYAIWHGGVSEPETVIYHEEAGGMPIAFSGFGSGILTFRIGGLIRTEPGYDLYVTGPVNRPKAGLSPLTAIVETDWATFGLTMNWKFTEANKLVHFAKDEPFCSFFPVPRGLIETFEPRFETPAADPQVWDRYNAFRRDRQRFNADTQIPDSPARRQRWQRIYLHGPKDKIDPPHRTRIKLKPFK